MLKEALSITKQITPKYHLTFPILTDFNNQVTERLGLVFSSV